MDINGFNGAGLIEPAFWAAVVGALVMLDAECAEIVAEREEPVVLAVVAGAAEDSSGPGAGDGEQAHRHAIGAGFERQMDGFRRQFVFLHNLLEKLAHQNRERIPERGQHAKGSGAYGTLTITSGTAHATVTLFGQYVATAYVQNSLRIRPAADNPGLTYR